MSNVIATEEQGALDQLDWAFDFSKWLPNSDVITGAPTITVEGPDALLENFLTTNDARTVTVWLRGGTVGVTYRVGCYVTTSSSPARKRKLVLELRITE